MTQKLSEQHRVVEEISFHGSNLSIESGWIAKQAGGSVIVRQGDTMILVTVCTAPARKDQDFFPLTVEYQEKAYAAGRIPGGFFKREGRPAESEILVCRLIDRPIRPLFPEGYLDEVQVICTVMSADGIHSPDVLAICGASAALHVSSAPFLGPIAGVRVGRINEKLVINPPRAETASSDLDFVIAGTKEAIVMVEGGAKMVPEAEVLEALYFGHQELQKIIEMQERLRAKVGKQKQEFTPPVADPALVARIKDVVGDKYDKAFSVRNKAERHDAMDAVKTEVMTAVAAEFPEREKEAKNILHDLAYQISREKLVREKVRIDGRSLTQVRPIECETGVIPRAHGSALFTRGETQAIVTTTLGTSMDAQRIDALTEQTEKTFMLHYNFPPYSTGEVKMVRGTGRRETGHGALAERALRPMIPSGKEFPYVVRIVSDITESNGSSSMASVCGGSMSLMDAGVKIAEPVGGVAMGLIKEGDQVAVLTDILGDEDHFGDMDFKVCGTKSGITAIQMDIKCTGLSRETMTQALEQAREARIHILGEMAKAIAQPRGEMSKYAPSIKTIKINPDKIRDVIGPGGKTIRSITETTGVKIDISDDGTVNIASSDQEASKRAIDIIMGLTEEAEVGKVYTGVVKRIMDFGAFVEILPGTEGLVHISQLAHERVNQVTDILKEGDEVAVRVLDIDKQGRIRLSRKEAMERRPN
ncbi:MAG: polyribonucleotide nucleotidyltransferase [Bdellovibrionota bacterium]